MTCAKPSPFIRHHGPNWPLGIDTIEIQDRLTDLPNTWQNILEALNAAGVTITEASPHSGVPELTIVRGPDEWSTAEAAARWLSNAPDHDKLCIIAGGSTTVLDHELARRGTPPLGIARRSATSPYGQVLPVFLSAILPPTDIRRVAEFLSLSLGTPDAESPAKALVPRSVSKALLNALTAEPGLSGDPDSAWMKALRDFHADADTDPEVKTKAAETAHTIDRLIRLSPPSVDNDLVDLTTLQPALDWLATRLRALAHHPGDDGLGNHDNLHHRGHHPPQFLPRSTRPTVRETATRARTLRHRRCVRSRGFAHHRRGSRSEMDSGLRTL